MLYIPKVATLNVQLKMEQGALTEYVGVLLKGTYGTSLRKYVYFQHVSKTTQIFLRGTFAIAKSSIVEADVNAHLDPTLQSLVAHVVSMS